MLAVRSVFRASRALSTIPAVFPRHHQFVKAENGLPAVQNDSFVAPSAVLVGAVTLGDASSVLYDAVVRGDSAPVSIGSNTTIGDKSVVVSTEADANGFQGAVEIGNNVVIGAKCHIRSSTIGNEAVIGAGSIILDHSLVEARAILLPGTFVPKGRRIPGNQVWGGSPAQYVRDISHDEEATLPFVSQKARSQAFDHKEEFLPASYLHVEAEETKL